MTIEAELADGTVLEFPDGTDTAVIQRVVKQRVTGGSGTPSAPAEPQRSPSQSAESPLPASEQPAPSQRGAGAARVRDVSGRIFAAMQHGYQNAPSLGEHPGNISVLTPAARQAVNQGPMGRMFVTPLADMAGTAIAAAGAVGAGTAQLINEVTRTAGVPELGRDINMGLQSLPAPLTMGRLMSPGAIRYTGNRLTEGTTYVRNRLGDMLPERPSVPAEPPGRFIGEHFGEPVPGDLPQPVAPTPQPAPTAPNAPAFVPPTMQEPMLVRLNRLLDEDKAANVNRPDFLPPNTVKDPVTGEVAPIRNPRDAPPVAGDVVPSVRTPDAVGAQATPSGQAVLTPEQAAEYGSVADKQWLYKSLTPGEAIPDEFIPGITPTQAQYEQTVQSARETKTARNLSKEAAQAEEELLNAHSTKRKEFFQETAGSDVTQGIAMRDADAAIDAGLAAAWRQGGTVDPQAIMEAIQAERSRPAGKLPGVKTAMKALEDAMRADDGSMEVDPRQVYGVHRLTNYMLSRHGQAENASYGDADVQAAILRVKDVIAGSIEPAAAGFREALANYSAAQRAIEVKEALQKVEPKLYDQFNRPQFSKVHAFMRDVIVSRDPNAPRNPWQSMTPEQLQRLKLFHDDLMRVASAEELAKARGSDTTPSFLDAVKQAAQGTTGTLITGGAGYLLGGELGAVAAPIVKGQIEGAFTRRAERKATEKMQGMLHPDPIKYPIRPNQLGPQ